MILKMDRLPIELPTPKNPSPNDAAAIQELLGGKFGDVSTLVNYTFQSFNFRGKKRLKPFYDLTASIAGEEYSIADMAIWPWYGNIVLGNAYDAAEFLDANGYKNVMRWAKAVAARPAVQRGRIVNRAMGPLNEQLRERHDAADFDTQTEDKRQA